MRKMILFSVIQQLLYHIARVESLIGENFTPIRGGEFPFFASFQSFPGEDNFCGGALITNKHVLTSAHCVRNVSPESFRIVFEVANAQGPAVAYTAASWTTYIDWARRHSITFSSADVLGAAIVTLTDRVDHVNPVALNGMNKSQLVGKKVQMIGWKNDVPSKTTVQLLSDEACIRNIGMLGNNAISLDDRALCTTADPYALLGLGDFGSPLLHAHHNSLLGIACLYSPDDQHVRGSFSTEFIRQHQVNIHISVYYYRSFIHSVVPAVPGA